MAKKSNVKKIRIMLRDRIWADVDGVLHGRRRVAWKIEKMLQERYLEGFKQGQNSMRITNAAENILPHDGSGSDDARA